MNKLKPSIYISMIHRHFIILFGETIYSHCGLMIRRHLHTRHDSVIHSHSDVMSMLLFYFLHSNNNNTNTNNINKYH